MVGIEKKKQPMMEREVGLLIIKEMYKNIEISVKIDGEQSKEFEVKVR